MKKIMSICLALVMLLAAVLSVPVGVKAENMTIEGWRAAKRADGYHFIVTEGGNQWNHAVNGTSFQISYPDGSQNSFQIGYNLLVKDANYGDIVGGSVTATETSRGGIYSIDILLPESFFAGADFTVTYQGTSIASADFADETAGAGDTGNIGDTGEANTDDPENADDNSENAGDTESNTNPVPGAVYTGITIDGDFADWDAVKKTAVGDGSVDAIAMIFDGEDLFIYIEEPEDSVWDVGAGAGVTGDGKFVITTDTGKQSVFYIDPDSVHERDGDIISGSSIVFAGKRIELRIPASFIKEYNETINLGYYNGNERLITDVANLQGNSSSQVSANDGSNIAMGDGYDDWTGYPHSTIMYSTTDAEGSGALYSDGSILYIHEITSNAVDFDETASNLSPFTIVLNGENKNDWNNCMDFMLLNVDPSGTVNGDIESILRNLPDGSYTFYIGRPRDWGYDGFNINTEDNEHHVIYGKAYVRVMPTGYEMECSIDLEKLAYKYAQQKGVNFTANDIKKIEVQFGDIGQEWITWSGTSTGPIPGVLAGAALAVAAAWIGTKRRKEEEFIPQGIAA